MGKLEELLKNKEKVRAVLDCYMKGEKKGETFATIAKELSFPSRYVEPLLREAIRRLLDENLDLSLKVGPEAQKSPIERELLNEFRHLKNVFVTPGPEITSSFQYETLVSLWVKRAARYVDSRVLQAAIAGKELHVSLSGGETILEIANSFELRERGNTTFYASALIGRPHKSSSAHVDAIANTTVAWSRSGRLDRKCVYATVNPFDLSEAAPNFEGRRRVISEQVGRLAELPSIKSYLSKDLSQTNIAIAGLGMVIRPEAAHSIRQNRLTASELLIDTAGIKPKDLEADGAIGDIGCCYFDANGKDKKHKWRFYLTAGDYRPDLRGIGFYRDLVKRKQDVIVCAGAFKEPALLAALKGELFNVWFTNESSARKILDDHRKAKSVKRRESGALPSSRREV